MTRNEFKKAIDDCGIKNYTLRYYKKANLPKDPFELATYKIIEMKFYTERYTSYYEPKIDHSATKI